MSKKKVKKKPSLKTKKKKPALKAVKRPRVWNKKASWHYDFNSGQYEMNEVLKGVTYKSILNQLQFYRMMNDCVNGIERKEWLSKNKKQPTKATK